MTSHTHNLHKRLKILYTPGRSYYLPMVYPVRCEIRFFRTRLYVCLLFENSRTLWHKFHFSQRRSGSEEHVQKQRTQMLKHKEKKSAHYWSFLSLLVCSLTLFKVEITEIQWRALTLSTKNKPDTNTDWCPWQNSLQGVKHQHQEKVKTINCFGIITRVPGKIVTSTGKQQQSFPNESLVLLNSWQLHL